MGASSAMEAGCDADIVIFDLDSIRATATYLEPEQLPTGYQYVLVNGVVVLEDDAVDTTVHPGTVLTNRYALK